MDGKTAQVVDTNLKLLIGDLTVRNIALTAQLAAAQARIAELEKPATEE